MKCNSCQAEIDPKWKHAIEANICPFCGKEVMAEHLKNLLTSLRDTMDQLQQYPDQLNDWLLSNHSYIKTDSPQIGIYAPKSHKENKAKEFDDSKSTIKIKTDTGEQEVIVEKIQSEQTTSEFFKRAEAVKPNIDGFKSTGEKTTYLKNLVQQIKRGETSNVAVPSSDVITPEMVDADPDAIAAMQAELAGSGIIASALPDNNDDEIPAAVLAMANRGAQSGGGNNNADLQKLQRMYNKVDGSKQNFQSGGGKFSRSG